MSEVPQAPESLEEERGTSLRAAISREMVKAMKACYGKGPTKAKSYFFDDLLFVVMRGGMTPGEKTLLEAGEADAVRAFRQHFENVMAERLTGTIEQLTERKVLTYQSQVLFDPDVVIEIFVFDKAPTPEAIEETAKALLSEEDPGTVRADDPGTDPE
ncbi:MAG TPA: DUF2294 domain-containing protein [Solirubrobacterales bacterium]|nr:DUF2294 domain-containing protein [Solirubrobacterales bacterium]